MNQNCKNCQSNFQIRDEDLKFYEKIDVPSPTWCPSCREMRRMAWANEGVLYSQTCDLCGKLIVTQFNPKNSRPVYCIDCWWSDKWDPRDYGKDIDWNRSIFEQIHELELTVPHACVLTDISNENSEYIHQAGQAKNSYLIFHATFIEDCYYGYGVKKAKDCMDIHYCHESELCYECIDVKGCHSLAWCQDCVKCASSKFLRDCVNCVDCFMCVGLRNKKYCFLNEQLTKEEYQEKMKEIDTGSYKNLLKYLKKFDELKSKHTYRYMQNNMIENSIGDYLYNAKNSYHCFDASDIENSAYCTQMQLGIRYCYDIYQYGVNAELCYEGVNIGTNAYNVKFSSSSLWQVADLTYCIESYTSKNCFGSVGLNHNKFCILNKQYSEEEYFELKDKIIQKMKTDKEYGEFFPIEYSQSAYNETEALQRYPMTREQVLAKGWKWEDDLPGTFGKETIKEIPDHIEDTDDPITKEVLACNTCEKNYKIIPQELQFYKKYSYPIPRECFDCRRVRRANSRNSRQYHYRECMKDDCTNEFYTTYSEDSKKTVYCESCYQQTIY